jgi:hypothetical protein
MSRVVSEAVPGGTQGDPCSARSGVAEQTMLELLFRYVRGHHDDRTHFGLAKETPAQMSVYVARLSR